MLETNGMSAADVAAVVGNNRSNNDGFGFGGDGAYLLLFLLLAMNGNWGNGNGGFGGNSGWGASAPYFYNAQTQNEVSRGFDQAAIANTLSGINASICNGFANVESAAANRQMASMQQDFAAQTALSGQMNTLAMALQNCCCENRANIADVKYTVATENCADRAAMSDGFRDLIANNAANTQRILDQMCSDKIDAKNEKIADLERQLTMANLAASQTAQTAAIRAGQVAEIDAMYNRLRDCPVPTMPVYGSQPIFSCPNNMGYNNSCGCNG